MSEPSFDLLTEPWVPVRALDGSLHELSLRAVFAQAHELTSLGGELATTGVALLRLLLAILHRTVEDQGYDLARPMAHWGGLWDAPTLPTAHTDAYLTRYADRFDLLHAERPFLQVPDLTTARGWGGSLRALIADVPNNRQLFSTRAGAALASMGFAEAARWVVHCQAYDPSGIKSGAVGDPRVKGGKGYPIGTAWAGGVGVVVAEGRTLKDTLLLNLVLQTRSGDPLPEGDSAVWERPPLTAHLEGTGSRVPRGPADLLTWPSRRLRLSHDGVRVTGVLVANGDALARPDRFEEAMTAWRRSEPQEKLLGYSPVYMPLQHQPERSVWRGLGALLPQAPPPTGDNAARRPPTTLQWLGELQSAGHLSADLTLRTRAVGLVYGTNDSVVDDLVDDALELHVDLLGEQGRALSQAAVEAVAAADRAARAVGQLAGNLTAAAGGDPEAPTAAARETYYFSLDSPFRRWLAARRLGDDPIEASRSWERFAHRVAGDLSSSLLESAGPAAWVGRQVTQRAGTRHVDAALADVWFRHALHEALPLARLATADAGPPEQRETP